MAPGLSLHARHRPGLQACGRSLALLVLSLPLPLLAAPAEPTPAGSGPLLAQGRQAYPYPASQPIPLGRSQGQTLSADPLAVCPSEMLAFMNNSTTRAVPFWVASRGCDCFAEERSAGASLEQSKRRCFP